MEKCNVELLLAAARDLCFDGRGNYRAPAGLGSSTCRPQAGSFLGQVDGWGANEDNSVEALFEKCSLYASIIDLAPQRDLKWIAIERILAILENSPLETEDTAL